METKKRLAVPQVGDVIYVDDAARCRGGKGVVVHVGPMIEKNSAQWFVGVAEHGNPPAVLYCWKELASRQEALRKKFGETKATLKETRMDYKPARSPVAPRGGRGDCPQAILRSHPDFPSVLSPELEGTLLDTNPAWPDWTVDLFLQQLDPPCHTDWKDSSGEEAVIEKRGSLEALVVYVRPGPAPSPPAPKKFQVAL